VAWVDQFMRDEVGVPNPHAPNTGDLSVTLEIGQISADQMYSAIRRANVPAHVWTGDTLRVTIYSVHQQRFTAEMFRSGASVTRVQPEEKP